MEIEIEDKLNEKYKYRIQVKFEDFRIYKIIFDLVSYGKIEFKYLYDVTKTIDANINYIEEELDRRIPLLFKSLESEVK